MPDYEKKIATPDTTRGIDPVPLPSRPDPETKQGN